MVIRNPPTVEEMARPPAPPNFRLSAAQQSLVAAFRERVDRDPAVLAHRADKVDWQRPLAIRIGISQATVNQLYAGKVKDLRLSMLLKLRAYIGQSLDDILGLPSLRSESAPVPDSSRTQPRSRRQ